MHMCAHKYAYTLTKYREHNHSPQHWANMKRAGQETMARVELSTMKEAEFLLSPEGAELGFILVINP